VGWYPFQDITTASMTFLTDMKQVRSEQAGAALDMQSAEQQGLKSISGLSAEMQLGPSEMTAAEASRNIANTMIKDAFLKMHQVLREEWEGPIQFYKNGEWQETDPSQWRRREQINITVALSPGERRRHASNLQNVIMLQEKMMTMGGNNVAVDINGIHKAVTDWMRSVSLNDSEGYFIDPMSEQGQQAQQSAQQAQQQQGQMAQQMQQMMMQMEQQKQQLEQQKAVWDKEDDDFDNETDRLKIHAENEREEAKLTVQAIGQQSSGQETKGPDNGSTAA
jgi:hypothetical protein